MREERDSWKESSERNPQAAKLFVEKAELVLQKAQLEAEAKVTPESLTAQMRGLNELTETGAALEVTFYDADFDEEDEAAGRESRDDFMMLFVGPTPAAIMQVQRDLLVEDVVHMMERHFDAAELSGVVAEIGGRTEPLCRRR